MSNTEKVIEILLADVLFFHEYLEKFFVMSHGIHDKGLLESAINAPFQSFGGIPVYNNVFEQAARICYGLAKNLHLLTEISALPSIPCLCFLQSINSI